MMPAGPYTVAAALWPAFAARCHAVEVRRLGASRRPSSCDLRARGGRRGVRVGAAVARSLAEQAAVVASSSTVASPGGSRRPAREP